MIKILPTLAGYTNFRKNIKNNDTKQHPDPIEPIIVPTFATPRTLNAKSDIFIQNLNTRKQFEEFLSKNGKVTFKEYQDIYRSKPAILVEAIKYVEDLEKHKFFTTTPELSAKLAILARKRLDSLYRKDNYNLISIGTSPSFITEGMNQIGVNTTFVPMSNASYINPELPLDEIIDNYPNITKIGEYLKYKGVNSDEYDGKKLIILDYCNKGRTIKLVKKIAQEYCKIPDDKVETMKLSDLLHGIRGNYNQYTMSNKEIFDPYNVLSEIDAQKVECMSNTPHFSAYNERYNHKMPFSVESTNKSDKELFNDFENFSKPSARAYQLCVLHELNKLRGKLL